MIQDFYILSSSRKAPKYLVIILHGYGANGKNLISMAHYWKNIIKDALFIVPDAPLPLAHTANGYQWFNIGDLSPAYLEKGSREAAPMVSTFVKNMQKAYNISWDKTILTGFSQGGMMALTAGLLHPHLCKGIISYSGGLFLSPDATIASTPDVCLIHGTKDSMVPHESSEKTQLYLQEKQIKVIFHSLLNIEHQITEGGLMKGAEFIKSVVL
jgi:phospholipase/carboxylesterase